MTLMDALNQTNPDNPLFGSNAHGKTWAGFRKEDIGAYLGITPEQAQRLINVSWGEEITDADKAMFGEWQKTATPGARLGGQNALEERMLGMQHLAAHPLGSKNNGFGKILDKVLTNFGTGGLWSVGEAVHKAASTGKILGAATDALANTGLAGPGLTATVGKEKSLAIQAAVAGGALGASSIGAAAPVPTGGESAMLAPAVGAGSPAYTAPVAGSGVLASGAAPATAGGSLLTAGNLSAAASVAGAATPFFARQKGPDMPETAAPPTAPTSENTIAQQTGAETRANDQAKRRTRTLLTGGRGASDYGMNSFAPSLIGNNTYLKSVIG